MSVCVCVTFFVCECISKMEECLPIASPNLGCVRDRVTCISRRNSTNKDGFSLATFKKHSSPFYLCRSNRRSKQVRPTLIGENSVCMYVGTRSRTQPATFDGGDDAASTCLCWCANLNRPKNVRFVCMCRGLLRRRCNGKKDSGLDV